MKTVKVEPYTLKNSVVIHFFSDGKEMAARAFSADDSDLAAIIVAWVVSGNLIEA